MSKPKGYILYEGVSQLDGKPIVAIATLESKNAKTGQMIQTWMIRSDMPPNEAVKIGADESVCGDCPQRHFKKGACYVVPFMAPLSIYKSYKKGAYSKEWNSETFKDTDFRVGAYGDPMAIPYIVWEKAVFWANKVTGYTHMWREHRSMFSNICMASVEDIKSKEKANELGYRTFRIIESESEMLPDEHMCFNYTHGISCAKCGLCCGNRKPSAKNFAVIVHGQKKKRFKDNI